MSGLKAAGETKTKPKYKTTTTKPRCNQTSIIMETKPSANKQIRKQPNANRQITGVSCSRPVSDRSPPNFERSVVR